MYVEGFCFLYYCNYILFIITLLLENVKCSYLLIYIHKTIIFSSPCDIRSGFQTLVYWIYSSYYFYICSFTLRFKKKTEIMKITFLCKNFNILLFNARIKDTTQRLYMHSFQIKYNNGTYYFFMKVSIIQTLNNMHVIVNF